MMRARKFRTRFILISCFLVVGGTFAFIFTPAIRMTSTKSTDGNPPQRNESSTRLVKIGDAPYSESLTKNIELQFIDDRQGWLSNDNNLWRTADGGESWKIVWRGKDPHSLPAFHFVSPRVGWQYTTSELLKTEDGGHTWKPSELPMTEGEIIDVYFVNEKEGWLAGSLFYYFQPNRPSRMHSKRLSSTEVSTAIPVIFSTTDGGETWRQHILSKDMASVAHNIQVVGGKVWVAGGVKLFYLENNRWKEVDYQKGSCSHESLLRTVGMKDEPSDGLAPLDIYFSDTKYGWILFPNGNIVKTTDGGDTWCDLFISEDETRGLSKIYFKDAYHGWGLDNHGTLLESNDGGLTWTRIDDNLKFYDMYFLSNNSGWVIGREGIFRLKL